MMRRMSTQSVLFLVLLLCSICTRHGCGAFSSEPGEPKVRCVDVERQALLKIKRSLQETWNHVSDDALSSWGSEDEKRDCCNWLGIKCANGSGRVVSLDLSPSTLGISDFFLLPALEGTQLQSFQNAYTGNPELCGDPLPKNCSGSEQTVFGASNEESGELLSMGFYISMALGFMTAFWGVCGALIFNKSFRYAYFKLLNDVGDQVFVTAAIQKTKLLRMIRS